METHCLIFGMYEAPTEPLSLTLSKDSCGYNEIRTAPFSRICISYVSLQSEVRGQIPTAHAAGKYQE
jgi:hypothetical protein